MQNQKKMIETRMPEEPSLREDEKRERFAYQAPRMFVIGSATHLMQGHNTGVKLDGGHALYYHHTRS